MGRKETEQGEPYRKYKRKGKEKLYLFECALGIEQVVDHVSRHTDE